MDRARRAAPRDGDGVALSKAKVTRTRSRPHPSPSPDRVRGGPPPPRPAALFSRGRRTDEDATRDEALSLFVLCRVPASSDALETLAVALPIVDVELGRLVDQLQNLVVDFAHRARRRADDQRVVGELLPFGDDGAGADQ